MADKSCGAFARFHPLTLLLYYLSVLTAAVFVINPIITFLTLLGGLLFCAVILQRRNFLKSLWHYLLLIIILSLANPLFTHHGDTPLLFINGKPITFEAVLYGVNMALTVTAVLMWCTGLSKTFTSDKVIYLFGKPFPKLALVLSMTLRYIPLFKTEYKKISDAQKVMGMFSSSGVIDKVANALKIFSALITFTLENSVDTSLSMNGRGYGLSHRTSFSLFKFTKRDCLMIAVNIVLISLVFFAIGNRAIEFYFYPIVSQLTPDTLATVSYVTYGILVFIPFAVEIKEVITWKLSELKI